MVIEIATIVATFLTAGIGYKYEARVNGRLTRAGRWLIVFAAVALVLSVYKLVADTNQKTLIAEERTKSESVALRSMAWQAGRLHTIVKLLLFAPKTRVTGSQELGQQVEGLKWSTSTHSSHLPPEVVALANAAFQQTDLPLSDLKNHQGGSVRLPMYLERLQKALSALAAKIQEVGGRVKGKHRIELHKTLAFLFSDWGLVATTVDTDPPSITVMLVNHVGFDLIMERPGVCEIHTPGLLGGSEILLSKPIMLKQAGTNTDSIRLVQGYIV